MATAGASLSPFSMQVYADSELSGTFMLFNKLAHLLNVPPKMHDA